MIYLKNDYCTISHPKILEKYLEVCKSGETFDGYGEDRFCKSAEQKILKLIGLDGSVFFLPGGTATNKAFISHVLRPYQAVICASSGHINVHETGTIEQSGHKVLTAPHASGKICPEDVEKICREHDGYHMVEPKMLYISNPTEYGTLYSKGELEKLSAVCKKLNLYFFIDGARLGSALAADESVSLADYARLSDSFYIGGTKNGMPIGEALFVRDKKLAEGFKFTIKNTASLQAKGFLIGIGFDVMFDTDGLYVMVGREENRLADKLRSGLKKLGVKLYLENPTNQVFCMIKKKDKKALREKIGFDDFFEEGDEVCIRLVTYFGLKESTVDEAIEVFESVIK